MLDIWWLRFHFPWAWTLILALVIASQMARGETLKSLGFRWDNLQEGLKIVLPFLLLVCAVALVAGGLFRTIRNVRSDNAILSFGYYCFWGLFQEYVLNGYFTNRVGAFSRRPTAHRTALWAAALFSAAHLPNWFLMLITLAGGYLSARFYLAYRNLFVLGLAHGAIGSILYLVVPESISHHLYVGPKWFQH